MKLTPHDLEAAKAKLGPRPEFSRPSPPLVDFTIPGLRLSGSQNAREHHFARAKRVEAEHNAVAFCWRTKASRLGVARAADLIGMITHTPTGKPKKEKKLPTVLRVTITRVGRSEVDSDNLAGYCKGVRDCVAHMLGIDDGDSRIEWRTEQKPGSYAVRVRVEEA